jgi:hypothetical protein
MTAIAGGLAALTGCLGQLAVWVPAAQVLFTVLTAMSGLGTLGCGIAIVPITAELGWSASPCSGCERLERSLKAQKRENEKLLEAIQ